MTARNLYEGVLIELNKENAPNVLLEDFNYFANKAINNYINKRYNIYDINQQTTDDLRVLKATAILTPTQCYNYSGLTMAGNNKMATYEVTMPSDYLHILNCICIYKVKRTYKCYNKGDYWRSPATRLTADMYSQVLDNFWNKPTYKRPYYYIHNVNTNHTSIPTNPYIRTYTDPENPQEGNTKIDFANGTVELYVGEGDHGASYERHPAISGKKYLVKYEYISSDWKPVEILGLYDGSADIDDILSGTDQTITDEGTYKHGPNGTGNSNTYTYGKDGVYDDQNQESQEDRNTIVQGTGNPDYVLIDGTRASNRERGQGIRYGNVSQVRLEIRYGTDNSVFALDKVYVDYIKAPQNIRLTQEEIDLTEDTSQMLEYPDYVCQEIINELVHLIMENISDQRLQTHPVVSQSIANPAQAQAPEQAGQPG